MESLQELLVEELKDLYSAEKQIVKALPKLVKAATSADLKAAFDEHLQVTKGQVTRLEQVFTAVGAKASAKHCRGMEGLLEEGRECLEEEGGDYRDLKLIAAAQRVEHYEIAAYGTVLAIAEQCGLPECIEMLSETLEEEESADETLTTVAEAIYAAVGGQPYDELEEDDDDKDSADEEEDEEMAAPSRGSASRAPAKQSSTSKGMKATKR